MGQRILLVEDERALALITERHLQALGYEVEIVTGGEAALSAVEREQPQLVLMDIVLGSDELDGVETTERLLERFDVPVIYLTGADDDITIDRAAQTEAYGYILKPIERAQLRSAIEMARGRHRAERRLVQTKQLLWTTLRSIGDGVLTTDGGGRVVMVNRAAEELLGRPLEELLGRPLAETLAIEPPERRAIFVSGVEAILAGAESFALPRAELSGRGGRRRNIALSAAPIRDRPNSGGAGETGIVLALRDISEELRSEQELLRRQRLETMERLAGGLAHDFNNVLMGMLSNVALARLAANGDQEIGDNLRAAEVAGRRASELTRQLLLFSDGAASLTRSVALGPLLRHQARLSLDRSAVSAHFAIDDTLRVEADEPQLNQLIHALVTSARDAMPQGGPLWIRARARELDEDAAEAHDLEAGPYVEVGIEDRGEVLPPEALEHAFDPYVSGARREAGLRLAAAHAIARHHGGTLAARPSESAEQGMCFVLLLPASSAQEPTPPARPRDGAVVEGHGSVLLMDDEEMICSTVGRLLARLGYRYEVALDGEAAITAFEAARERGEPFDAVILDWTIRGGLGGERTLQRLRELDPEVVAILATGYAQGQTRDAETVGFRKVLYKPYTMAELSEALAEVLQDPH